MGGGLIELVATGPQDVYLTENPQITFFKIMYKRYTNFSIDYSEINFNSIADFGKTVTCLIPNNGDLVNNTYLKIVINKSDEGNYYGFVHKLGHVLIDNMKILLGGLIIDEQYGDWLNIWTELTIKESLQETYNILIGNTPNIWKIEKSKDEITMFIPLQFWFCRNNGLAIPLIALQYSDLKIQFTFKKLENCINIKYNKNRTDISFKDASLIIEYIYLDTAERNRFAKSSHEYLIEQVQTKGETPVIDGNENIQLGFYHPCKALYWTVQIGDYINNTTIIFDDFGKININYFSKILWVITRDIIYINKNNIIYVQLNSINNSNFLSPGSIITNNDNNLYYILNKIKAQFLFFNPNYDINAEILDNIFIRELNLDNSDISITIDDIIKNLPSDYLNERINLLYKFTKNINQYDNYGLYVNKTENPCLSARLLLNGHDRFSERKGSYFNYVQPYQHFTRTPSDGINVYSFSINPEEHQPSGTCNMSKIDNIKFNIKIGIDINNNILFQNKWLSKNTVIKIYTVNYNILRIMGGLGGLAYNV